MQTLYDFIFIDQERVRSIYTQMFEGLHEAVEKVASSTTSKNIVGQIGGEPIGKVSYTNNSGNSEAQTDRFIPHDLILRDVLGNLVESNMINQDPESAKPGNFILLNGRLTLLDVTVLKSLIAALPNFSNAQGTSDYKDIPKAQRKKAANEYSENQKNIKVFLELFSSMMPTVVQFNIANDKVSAWGAVQQKNMRAEVAHLFIQQGPTLNGEWYVLGIVDSDKNTDIERPKLPQVFEGIYGMLDSVRSVFAKSDTDISITPLIIFRKLLSE